MKEAIRDLIQQAGGTAELTAAIQQVVAEDAKAQSEISAEAVSLTVNDWAVFDGRGETRVLLVLIDDINAAIAAKDADVLGPLLVALFKSERTFRGKDQVNITEVKGV